MVKKISIGIGFVLGLIILAIALLSFLVDEAKIFDLLADSVEKETQSELIIGDDSAVSFFPTLGLNLVGVKLIPNNPTNSSVEAREVEVGVTLSSLLTGTLEIKTVRAVGLKTAIIQKNNAQPKTPKALTDEELEAKYAERRSKLEVGVTGEGLPPIPLDLEIGILEIIDAAIAMDDPESKTSQTIEIAELNIRDLNTRGEPSSISGNLSISGDSNIEFEFESELKINLSNGIIQLSNTNMELAGATPESLLIAASGELDLNKEAAQLDIELRTDQIKATGSIQRKAFQSPEIDMDLAVNLIDPAMLVIRDNKAENPSPAINKDNPPEFSKNLNNTQDAPLPLEGLRELDIRAQLRIDEVSLGPNLFKEVGATLRIVEGVLTLSEVTGEFNGGSLSLESQLNAKYNTATFSAEGGLEGVDFNQFAASYGSPGIVEGKGSVSLDLSSKGSTQKEMINNLTGPVKIKTSDVSLQRISLEKTMCQGIALINKKPLSQPFPSNTEFASLDANLTFADGTATIGPLSADLASLKLDGGGKIDLLSNDFSLNLKGTIFESISELDPACLLDSKYANLVWPMNCEGNLSGNSSEWCKVDTADVLAQLGKSTIKDKATKKAKTYIKKLFGG